MGRPARLVYWVGVPNDMDLESAKFLLATMGESFQLRSAREYLSTMGGQFFAPEPPRMLSPLRTFCGDHPRRVEVELKVTVVNRWRR